MHPSPFFYKASRVPCQLRVPREVPTAIAHLKVCLLRGLSGGWGQSNGLSWRNLLNRLILILYDNACVNIYGETYFSLNSQMKYAIMSINVLYSSFCKRQLCLAYIITNQQVQWMGYILVGVRFGLLDKIMDMTQGLINIPSKVAWSKEVWCAVPVCHTFPMNIYTRRLPSHNI